MKTSVEGDVCVGRLIEEGVLEELSLVVGAGTGRHGGRRDALHNPPLLSHLSTKGLKVVSLFPFYSPETNRH